MGETLAGKAWGSLKSVMTSRRSIDSASCWTARDHGPESVHALNPEEVNGLPPLKSPQNGSATSQQRDSRNSGGYFTPLSSISSRRSDAESQPGSHRGSLPDQDHHLDRRKSGTVSWLRNTLSRHSSMLDPGLPSRRSGEGGTGAENGVANGRQPGSPTEGRGGNVAPRQGGVANGRQPGSPTEGGGSIDPRQEFLEAYDAATLQLCNRLFEREASCIADTGFREVAPWNRVPGYLGYLDSRQKQALLDMRKAFPQSKKWHTDHDILRFLRARDFDLRKSQEMYRRYVDEYRGRSMISPNPPIRPTHGPFQLSMVEAFPERDPSLTERLRKLMDWFLHTAAFGLDKEGRPVVYFRPRDIIKNNMGKHVPVDDRISFQSSANEMLLLLTKMASQKAGYHIDNITQVLDLSGMSAMQMVSHMRSTESQKEWQHNMDFQPEVLHKIYVICAPSGMPLIWKVASPFLPAATKKKVEILGSGEYKKVLEQAIGRDNLPSCYGGEIKFEWPAHRHIKDFK